jgi:hypothetical protein
VAAESERAAENVVLCTTTFDNLSLAADVAFVQGVGQERTAPAEFSAQLTLVDRAKPAIRSRNRTCSNCFWTKA